MIVDANGDLGLYTDIALDKSGYVHISYYDQSNKDLKAANNASGSWETLTVDPNGDVGEFSSIAIDHLDNIHISYWDTTNADLTSGKDDVMICPEREWRNVFCIWNLCSDPKES